MIKLRSTTLDGHLFLVRHLLIMKEITSNLDLVRKDYESGTVNFAGTFIKTTCLQNSPNLMNALDLLLSRLPDALFSTFGVPRGDGVQYVRLFYLGLTTAKLIGRRVSTTSCAASARTS